MAENRTALEHHLLWSFIYQFTELNISAVHACVLLAAFVTRSCAKRFAVNSDACNIWSLDLVGMSFFKAAAVLIFSLCEQQIRSVEYVTKWVN